MSVHDFPVSHSLSGFEGLEERLISLESRLELAEYRLRSDLLQRDRAWRERITTAMSLLARMLAAAVSASPLRRGHGEDPVRTPPGELPIPGLEPHAITGEEYHAHSPEKFELWEGYLFSGAADPDARRRLLALLLVNVGLLDAVTLAPEERWREALERVYGG